MYYPYLRAKQFELKAIREFSSEHTGQNIILPILEPVKQLTNALSTAIDDMIVNGLKFALIINPNDGDFKHPTVNFSLWQEKDNMKQEHWIPALLFTRNGEDQIRNIIREASLHNVMIVFRDGMDLDDEAAWSIINDEHVGYVVNAFGSSISRRLRSKLKNSGKQIIRLDDCFKSRLRNADYALNVDEFFSEEPFFYDEDGYFEGYSDYTTLPSDYVEGGMLPYALVIHLTYKKNEDQLYVHHFVSDSNETNSDVRRKFREAARKVAPFFEGKQRTPAIEEIIAKANDPDGYPGLGYIKKLSIKNHLDLIASLR